MASYYRNQYHEDTTAALSSSEANNRVTGDIGDGSNQRTASDFFVSSASPLAYSTNSSHNNDNRHATEDAIAGELISPLPDTPDTPFSVASPTYPIDMSLTPELTPRQIQIATAILILASFQYGYHIGELNSPKDAITQCPSTGSSPKILVVDALADYVRWSPGPCVPMTDTEYSFVTAALTLGGLTGSFVAGHWASRWTRQKAMRWGLVCLALGAIWTSLSDGPGGMAFGRWLAGFGSAVAVVVVPLWLTELAPVEQRGMIGVMNQLGIVVGILAAQILGLFLSSSFVWRYILLAPGLLGIIQLVMMPICPDTRSQFLEEEEAERARHRSLRGQRRLRRAQHHHHRRRRSDLSDTAMATHDADVDTEDPYASDTPPTPRASRLMRRLRSPSRPFTLAMLVRRPYLRPMLAVLLCLLGQQFSGINAVMYYSTPILSAVMPSQAALISVYISIANLVVTLLAARFMDRYGKRKLLLYSIFGMCLASLLLSFAISYNAGSLAALLIILVVSSFGVGLGPIPFLVAPDLFPPELAGQAQSVGMAANWVGNLIVAALFLPIRNYLGGWIFAVFSGILLCQGIGVLIMFVPEDEDNTIDVVHRDPLSDATSKDAASSVLLDGERRYGVGQSTADGIRMRLRGVTGLGWQPVNDSDDQDYEAT
ncbi:major facilitator superfamily domain-containing protein [Syncephalis plumigaleata]|nr:major facilitator superfamily domain-containing protein [Syncephalis plumigaleata]